MQFLEGALLDEIRAHAQETYPRECCGLVVESAKGESVARRCTNIADTLHRADPRRHPAGARDAYDIDPRDLLAAFEWIEENRGRLRAVYHSHIDSDALFSEVDRMRACPEGVPLYDELVYLIVSVHQGTVRDISFYTWSDAKRRFVKKKDPVPVEAIE